MSALLALALAAQPAHNAPAPPPAAYRQMLPDGSVIDWLEGRLVVAGRTRIVYDIEASKVKARLTTLKAEGEGRERLLTMVGGLYLDGATRLGDDPERVRTARLKLQGVKSTGQSRKQPGWLTAMMVVPLWGEGGVLGWYLDVGEGGGADATVAGAGAGVAPAAGSGAPGAPAAGDENGREAPSGLIVDATHLTGDAALAPALLPRVVDEKGLVLHGLSTAEPMAARQIGLVAYAIVAPHASNDDPESPPPAPREGASPLRVKAVAAGGPARSDIVVSTADGDRIRQAALDGAFLEECRVVILMPPPPKPKVDVISPPRKPPTRSDPTAPGNVPKSSPPQ